MYFKFSFIFVSLFACTHSVKHTHSLLTPVTGLPLFQEYLTLLKAGALQV